MERYVKFIPIKTRKQKRKQKLVEGKQQPEDLSLSVHNYCIERFREGILYSDFENFLLNNDEYNTIVNEGDVDEILNNLKVKGLVEVVEKEDGLVGVSEAES